MDNSLFTLIIVIIIIIILVYLCSHKIDKIDNKNNHNEKYDTVSRNGEQILNLIYNTPRSKITTKSMDDWKTSETLQELMNETLSTSLPKIIYCYWDNLDLNPLIQAHINTWKRNIDKDWKIIILDKNNVVDYVGEDFMNKYGVLNPTVFADFLRIFLLIKTGGVWMDASTIVIDGEFLNRFRNETIKGNYDACLFEFRNKTNDPKIPYLENWFIMAPKNSKLLKDLYREFDKAFTMGFLKYKNRVLVPSGVNLKGTLGYFFCCTYLMQHAIINYLMYTGNKYKVNVKNAADSMFKIQCDNDWNHAKIIDFIHNNDEWDGFYAIKLISSNRNAITDHTKFINKLNTF